MAIQTGGFGVQVMPQVQMADPRLLAFNPALIGQGIDQGMGMARNAQDFRIKQAQQKEWELLAPSRQAADLARFNAIAKLTPAETEAALQDAANRKRAAVAAAPNIEAKAQADAGKTEAELAGQAFAKGQRPTVEGTTAAKNQADLVAAQTAQDTATKRAEIEKQTLDNMYSKAVTEGAMQPDEAKLARKKLDDQLLNAKDDMERARIKERADIDLINAQIKKLESDAAIDNSFKSAQRIEVVASSVASQIDRLWKREVTLPDGTIGNLRDYFAATRDPSRESSVDEATGEVKEGLQKEGNFWLPKFMEKDIKLDPENEEAIKTARALLSKYNVLQRKTEEIYENIDKPKSSGSAGVSPDKFEAGKIYPGKDNTKARYLGNGKWEKIK